MPAEILIEELSKLDPKTWVSVIVADDSDDEGNLDAETGLIYECRGIVQTGDRVAAIIVDAAFGEQLDDDEVAGNRSTATSEPTWLGDLRYMDAVFAEPMEGDEITVGRTSPSVERKQDLQEFMEQLREMDYR